MDKDFEPLKYGWFRPRETARYLIDYASTKYIIFLMSILTIISATVNGNHSSIDIDLLWVVFLLVVIFSPLVGVVSVAISAFFPWIIGKMVKGEGSFKDICKVSIGANIPLLLAFPFMLAWAILEPESFLNEKLLTDAPIEIIGNIVLFVSTFWSLVNMVIAISEANRFSIGKALFTIFIPIIVLFALVLTYVIVFLP